MCISASISSYLGLVPYGKHGIEIQFRGRKIALFQNNNSVKCNWREAVMFAIGWHQTLFYSATEAQAYATERDLVVYTWQCFGKQNWLRRGATIVDVYCYTVLPCDAPESVRLADDFGDNMPQDDLQEKSHGRCRTHQCAHWSYAQVTARRDEMTEEKIRERLNELSEVLAARDVVRIDYETTRAKLIPEEIRASLADLETVFAMRDAAIALNIEKLEKEIKQIVLAHDASVKGAHLHAVRNKSCVNWDSRGLDHYAAHHPDVLAFRSEGEESVILRKI